jgi:transketolase
MPSWELFEAQNDEYRSAVIDAGTVRIAIEAGSPMGWERYTGANGAFIGMRSFGASAPYKDLYKHFGITAEAAAEAALARLNKR